MTSITFKYIDFLFFELLMLKVETMYNNNNNNNNNRPNNNFYSAGQS